MRTHTGEDLFRKAASVLAGAVKRVMEQKGRCTLGIVGGRSIPGLLTAFEEQAPDVNGMIDVFWLDERVGKEKNYTGALEHLKRLSGTLTLQWHPFVSMDKQGVFEEISDAEERLGELGMGFDVVVLSAGEDGHVCSLFPHHPALTVNEKHWVFVENAPKPPPLRVTVTVPLLLTARYGLLFFMGGKRDAYAAFTGDRTPVEECPARFCMNLPELDVFVDLE